MIYNPNVILIQNTSIGLYRTTPEGKITLGNPALIKMLGYNNFDELARLNLEKEGFGKNTPRSQFQELIERNGIVKGLESGWVCKDGAEIYVRENATAFHDSNGKPIYYEGTVENITDKRNAEIFLKESEEKYRMLIDNIQDGVFVIRDWKILFANEAFAAMIGYTTDEVFGKEFKKFVAPEDLEMVVNNYTKRMRGEPAPNEYEFRALHKDGFTRVFVNMTIGLITYENKPAVLGTVKDITENKKIQEILANKERHYRTLFDLSPSGIVVIGSKGTILDVNESFCKYNGYTQAELQGNNISILVPKDKREDMNIHIQKILNGETIRNEVINVSKDGSLRNIELNETRVILPDGQIGILSLANDITERKQAEEDYRTMIEQSNDMIWTLDKEGQFTFFNTRSEEVTGYFLNDWIGKSFAPLIFKEDLPTISEIFIDTLKGQSRNYEVRIFNNEGQILLLSVNTAPIMKAGEITGSVSFGRDITKQKLAEEKLQTTHDYLENLIDYASAPIIVWDPDSRITRFNHGFERLSGYMADEVIGKKFITLFPKKDRDKSITKIKSTLSGKYWDAVEIPILCKSGKIRMGLWNSANIYEGNGTILKAVIAQGIDITDRKRGENIQKVLYNISQAVILSETLEELIKLVYKQLGTLIDTTNFYFAFYDEKTEMISFPFMVSAKDEFVSFPTNKTMISIVIKTKKPLLAKEEDMLKLEKSGEIEIIGIMSKVWLGVPLFKKDKVIGVLAVQSYEDENAYNADDANLLEFISHQISISIDRKKAEQDLVLALENATESDRLKSAFLATMSHELRTPLNAIIGFSDLMSVGLPAKKVVDFAKIVNSSGIHLLTIVEDLFDITLIESGQIKIHKKEENLLAILKNVHAIINAEQQLTGKDNLDLNLIIPPDSEELTVHTDSSKLKQILINLLKNALKFTDEGHVSYGYTIKKDHNNSLLIFYVEDTGIGIPEEKKEFIFDIFRQAQESYTKTHGGTGIGLTISKKLTELLGGRIWLESKVGKGSTFYFTIAFKGQSDKSYKVELENPN